MQELVHEIRKLIEYVGSNGTIKKEDIDKLSIKKIESVIFDLTDNLGKKNIGQALEVLKELIYQKPFYGNKFYKRLIYRHINLIFY